MEVTKYHIFYSILLGTSKSVDIQFRLIKHYHIPSISHQIFVFNVIVQIYWN